MTGYQKSRTPHPPQAVWGHLLAMEHTPDTRRVWVRLQVKMLRKRVEGVMAERIFWGEKGWVLLGGANIKPGFRTDTQRMRQRQHK